MMILGRWSPWRLAAGLRQWVAGWRAGWPRRLAAIGLFTLPLLCLGHPFPASRLDELAVQEGWLKLGHYERSSRSATGWSSAIQSRDFFLADRGRIDPRAELEATLEAFFPSAAAVQTIEDSSARCRFPARWLWLQRHLALAAEAERPTCDAYRDWTRGGQVQSLSIVLASGFLGNPASFYGHTLLKFNFAGADESARLLDVTVNYGALAPKTDGPVKYIVSSLFGGYDAAFSHIGFYFHDHQYGDIEQRDLWEYRLDLPPAAVQLIVAHAWEVLGKHYTYGFFRDNCAYRMGELLEVVDDLQVLPRRWPWIVPQALIQQVGKATYQGHSLLARVAYHPSRQSRFYARVNALSAPERAMFENAALRPEELDASNFTGASLPAQQATLDTLLDYYQFTAAPLEQAPRDTRVRYAQVLARRFSLPPGAIPPAVVTPESPHTARDVGWLQLGLAHGPDGGQAMSLRIRPAYYDPLDAEAGHVANGALVMADTQLNVRQNGVSLHRLTLFGVENAETGLTGLPGDARLAWKINAGVEPQQWSCRDCLVARLRGDVGWTQRLTSWAILGAYVGGAVQTLRQDEGPTFGAVSVMALMRPRADLALRLEHEQRLLLHGRVRQPVTRLDARWYLGHGHDLRVLHERNGGHVLTVGIGTYW